MTERLAGVVTTIQPPTPSVRRLVARLAQEGAATLIVGDGKGPETYDVPGARLLGIADQLRSPFSLARLLPLGHYARKNLGYLQALADGADCIYETDDDNHPTPGWARRARTVPAALVDSPGWFNAYAPFSRELIWPRGLPLDRIRAGTRAILGAVRPVDAPIQQGLADGAPDVDAVWRLVLDHDVRFEPAQSVALGPGTWCPFNSQSTWWWAPAFALMYLPSHCSFRMTDIWRSLVAQRCLWELGMPVAFHAPEVEQVRNAHDLVRDFEQELPGYRWNHRIAEVLGQLSLARGTARVLDNLFLCWERLVAESFVPAKELDLVRAWTADVESLLRARARDRTG